MLAARPRSLRHTCCHCASATIPPRPDSSLLCLHCSAAPNPPPALGAAGAAAALAGAARRYAVVPPTRGSHEEVLEHLGSLFAFEGKVAMITGAAGGVGAAAALGFAK